MNKKTLFIVIGLLCLVASLVMNQVGKRSSHLSELKDFWWAPLPLALLCLLAAFSQKPK
jgi:hypothetical protein